MERPPTLTEQRDACRETAAELRTGSTDCSTAEQAIYWDQKADALQARIDAGEE